MKMMHLNTRSIVFAIMLIPFIGCQENSLPLGLGEEFSQWNDRVYGPTSAKEKTLPNLEEDIKEARTLVSRFFQSELVSEPPIIYLETAEQFRKYGSEVPFIAMNKVEDQGYILLNGARNPDENGIAHEWAHMEYLKRVGSEADQNTPVWFKEGMTLQLDKSGRFALDSLLQYNFDLDSLPDVTQYATMDELIDAPRPEIFKRLRISHYLFTQWYSKDRLDALMDRLAKGEEFEMVFQDLAEY